MYIYVYRITNLINNKQYVGVHTTNRLDDGYLGSGVAISRAVKKYGADKFHKEIISFFETKTLAYEHERKIVTEEYVAREDTYNMTVGGNFPPSRKGAKLDETTIDRYRKIVNTPERKQASSNGGKKGIRHVKENGWSQEAIEKRTETREQRNSYSTDMSACHTPEALAKRVETRKVKGVKNNTVNANSPASIFQRQKTKYITLIQKIATHYDCPITLDILIQSRRINIDNLLKYFTVEEILQISYCE